MKIQRKFFAYPEFQDDQPFFEVTDTGLFGSKSQRRVYKPRTFQEVLAQVYEFVDNIGPERLVNIDEGTEALDYRGDDGRRTWVIWYWQATVPETRDA